MAHTHTHIYIYIPGTQLTRVLIGKGHILGGWWSKIEVIQVLGIYIYIYSWHPPAKSAFVSLQASDYLRRVPQAGSKFEQRPGLVRSGAGFLDSFGLDPLDLAWCSAGGPTGIPHGLPPPIRSR